MNYILVIPARYKSSRFPGKPLTMIAGKTMIQRVYEQCLKSVLHEKIYVATEDNRILDYCNKNGIQCILTSDECLTGTDRVGEIADLIDADYYINVQGDEPIFNPEDINLLIKELSQDKKFLYEVYCGFSIINEVERFFSTDVPKTVVNNNNELLYISRAPIPGNKNENFISGYRQVCAYAFSKNSLNVFSSTKSKTLLEQQEDIELIRFLELGFKVKMIEMSEQSVPVDREEDIERVIKKLKSF